jgi:hypothetical protein
VYGNQPATLSNNEFNPINKISLFPNPTSGLFTINGEVAKVQVFSITGQLVKSFNAISSEGYQFDINDLNRGVYLVKAFDVNNSSKTMKLIKQ